MQYLDPLFLVQTLGTIGVIAIIFAESGLFFGFFLPGDSLLFTAGLLASQGYFALWPLLIGGTLAAILGDSVGYAFGKKMGPRLFSREDSRFFKKAYVEKTRDPLLYSRKHY
jgi:membrane-associated protein